MGWKLLRIEKNKNKIILSTKRMQVKEREAFVQIKYKSHNNKKNLSFA